MKKRSSMRLKSILAAAVMAISLLSPAMSGGTGAAYAAEEGITVQFEQPYAIKDQALTVTVSGVQDTGDLTYEWSVGGNKLDIRNDTYTPVEADLEKMIQVTVRAADGKSLGNCEMYFSEIPVIYIETEDRKEITSKEVYLDADMRMQGSEKYNTGLYNGKTKIRGRGNATWSNPKKPYKLKLDKSSDILGMGKSKHWVLLANYVDASLLRNKVSYDFSGAMGMPYMQSVHADVILNGSYIGNYQLCEQVKLEEDRVNIEGFEDKVKDAAKAISKKEGIDKDTLEDSMIENLEWVTSDQVEFEGKVYKVSDYCEPIDITGGYLLELDYYDDEVSQIITNAGKRVKFKNPEYAVTNDELYNYVKKYLNTFEAAVYAKDFHTEYEGKNVHYTDLFDLNSLIQFWLVQEIFFNWDGMNNSNYMYKEVDGLMYMGPIWDMDNTAGNGGTGSTTTWQTFGFDFWQHPNQWYRSITKDPYFIVQACNYYHSIRDTLIADMVNQITELDKEIHISGRANINRWHSGYFTSQVNGFKNWMENHLSWMDQQFVSPQKMIESLGQYSEYGYRPDTSIGIDTEESEGKILLEIQAASAECVSVYINGKLLGVEEMTGDKVSLQADRAFFTTDGTPNTVQVFRCTADGKPGESNFATFESPELIEVPDPEKPDPDKPDPDKPDPEKPDPEKPDPDKTDPDKSDPEKPDPDKTDPDNLNSDSPGQDQENPNGLSQPGTSDISGQNKFNVSSLKLQKGQSAKVLELAETAVAGDQVVRWSSSKPETVKVNAKTGKLSAKKTGSAVITATLKSGASVTCKVTVTKKPVATKKITLAKSSVSLKRGKKYKINIKVRLPLTANDKITYRSQNSKIAVVSAKGTVTAKKKGQTSITVKAASGKKAKLKIKVL